MEQYSCCCSIILCCSFIISSIVAAEIGSTAEVSGTVARSSVIASLGLCFLPAPALKQLRVTCNHSSYLQSGSSARRREGDGGVTCCVGGVYCKRLETADGNSRNRMSTHELHHVWPGRFTLKQLLQLLGQCNKGQQRLAVIASQRQTTAFSASVQRPWERNNMITNKILYLGDYFGRCSKFHQTAAQRAAQHRTAHAGEKPQLK